MAGTPIKLRVDVDMGALISEAKKAGGAVEDLGDEFTDAGDASTDAARDAKRGLGDIEDKAGDAAGEVGKVGDAAGTVGDALGDLGGVAKDALEGDVAGAAEGVFDAVGNLAGAIPGIGTAVALAAGVAGTAFAIMQADSEATQQRISDMYEDMVDSQSAALSQTFLLSEAQKLVADPARLAEAQRYSDVLGIDLNTVIGALVGDTEDLATAQEAVGKKIDDVSGKVGAFSVTEDSASSSARDLYSDVQEAGEAFDKTGNAADTAAGKYLILRDYADDLKGSTDGAKTSVDLLNAALGDAPPEVKVKYTVDDSAINNWRPPFKQGVVSYNPAGGTPAARFYEQDLP